MNIKPERVTSLRAIKHVFAQIDTEFTGHEIVRSDYTPNIDDVYYRLGKGLMIYEINGISAEMHAALLDGDVGKGFVKQVKAQWAELEKLGIKHVYTIHESDHIRASALCGAAGMSRAKTDDDTLKAFEVFL